MAGCFQAVRDHDDGLPVRVALVQHAEQLRGRAGIERAGGFVREQQRGFGDQRASRGGALVLAARYLVREFGQQRRDAQPRGQRQQAGLHLLAPQPGQHEREHDVFAQRKRVQQVAVLKDEAQPVAPERGERAVRDRSHVLAVQQDAAVGRAVERGEQGEQRGLAAAAFAHHGDKFALRHPEADPAQRGHPAPAEARYIFLCQTIYL